MVASKVEWLLNVTRDNGEDDDGGYVDGFVVGG